MNLFHSIFATFELNIYDSFKCLIDFVLVKTMGAKISEAGHDPRNPILL